MSDPVLFVLGAGASAGAVPSFRLPLTSDLFSSDYSSIAQRYPGISRMRQEIATRVRNASSLEQELTLLAHNRQTRIRRLVREIPPYLRDVIESQTRQDTHSLYDRLVFTLVEHGIPAMFLTLNYDRLLEAAIERHFDSPNAFSTLRGYIFEDEWKVVKLHGSVDWSYRVACTRRPTEQFAPLELSLSEDFRQYVAWLPDQVAPNADYLELTPRDRYLCTESMFYPALAIPTLDKYQPLCPPEHLDAVAAFVARQPHVVVIGTRCVDDDLLELLRRSTASHPPRSIQVVDRTSPSEIQSAVAGVTGVTSWEPSTPSTFEEWLDTGRARDLLRKITS